MFTTAEIEINIKEIYDTFYQEYNDDIVEILETYIITDLADVISSFIIPEVTKKFIKNNKIVTFETMTLSGIPPITTNYGYTDIFLVLQSRLSLNNVGKNNFKILDATFCDIHNEENYNKLSQVQLINGFHSTLISVPLLPLLRSIYLYRSEYDTKYINKYIAKNPKITFFLK